MADDAVMAALNLHLLHMLVVAIEVLMTHWAIRQKRGRQKCDKFTKEFHYGILSIIFQATVLVSVPLLLVITKLVPAVFAVILRNPGVPPSA